MEQFHTKKRKATLLKIASPDKMDTSEAEFSYETSPIEKEEGVNDRKDYKNKKYDTWVNGESWVMMKNCFPDAKPIKNAQKLFYANNVHMFKKI